MSELKLISPMLDNFSVGSAISEHDGVRCFPAMRQGSDVRYIIKVISIPASQVQLHALLLTGAYRSENEAKEYFAQLANGIRDEVGALSKLAKLEGFLAVEDCAVVEKENEVGYDVYLLTTYKRTLQRHFRSNPMTYLAAINLGLDMCASLAVARQTGYLYANLKPSNIFISDDNEYRIGDLGFLSLSRLKYATLPDRYRSQYTAPELSDPFAQITPSIDIYSAGLVLYQAYNGGVLPFEGQAPSEPLPPPIYADYEISEIILKACAPDPADRWENPIQMGQALISYMQRNGVNDTPIIPPVPVTEQETEEPVPFEEEPPADEEPAILFEQADEAGQMMIEQMLDFDSLMNPAAEESVTEPAAEAVEAPSAEDTPAEDSASEVEDDPTNLSFLDTLSNDETAPQEENADQIIYSELSDDANDILSIADDLIAHELPAPPVAPEPIDVPLPPPIILEDPVVSEDASQEEAAPVDTEQTIPQESDGNTETEDVPTILPAPAEPDAGVSSEEAADTAAQSKEDKMADTVAAITDAVEASGVIPVQDLSSEIDIFEDNDTAVPPEPDMDTEDPVSEEEDITDPDVQARRKKIVSRVLTAILILIILACIALGGYIFYRDYYLKTVESITVNPVDDQVSIFVVTDAEEKLITVVCVSHIGERFTSPLVNGTAVFTELDPDTKYDITLEIAGFHDLLTKDGKKVHETFCTDPKTEISGLTYLTGSTPGSINVYFSASNSAINEWVIRYRAQDEEDERVKEFAGTFVSVEGLTIGKTYDFQIDSADGVYVVGQTSFTYKATDLIKAENLTLTQCNEEGLTVTWDTPEGANIGYWTVSCDNAAIGYSEILTTEGNEATFAIPDPTALYNVKITASGMSESADPLHIYPNTVTITNVTCTPNDKYLDINWEFYGPEPTSQWILYYTVDDQETEYRASTQGAYARIEPMIPGATYHLKWALDATTIINNTYETRTPVPGNFAGYTVSAADMELTMCKVPNIENWTHKNVTNNMKKTTFAVGEQAGFIMRLYRRYLTSQDVITQLFVVRTADGKLVSFETAKEKWIDMWFQFYGELTVPNMPTIPGDYTVDIYFNGAYVHTQTFTITE